VSAVRAERSWSVQHLSGPAAELHARTLPEPVRRTVWVMRVERPALALGSTQGSGDVDAGRAAQAEIELVRRRSGGGAVLLLPDDPVWIDLIVPAGDELWLDDVGRAAWWVGEAWCRALARLGADPQTLSVHRGPLERTEWSNRVCFATVGAGEVTSSGRKVVGISQRRTRHAARFQCAAVLHWDPQQLVDLLALSPSQRRACSAAVATTAVGVGQLVAGVGEAGGRPTARGGADRRGRPTGVGEPVGRGGPVGDGDLRSQVAAAFLSVLQGG
jgi:lipoate---protein ligase